MPKVKVIIQCRTSSSRLPGKAFLPILGIASIVLCAKRAMNKGADVLVATSDSDSDNYLAQFLNEQNISFFRGPLDDVLKRYTLACEDLDESDLIVRLTADNVFPDGAFINEIANYALHHGLQYCSTDQERNGLPYGLGCEVFTVRLLRKANRAAISAYEREHVTPWMRKESPNTYLYQNDLSISHLRCTLDTLGDYLSLQNIFAGINNPIETPWQALCQILSEAPSAKMRHGLNNNRENCTMTLGTAQLGIPYGVTNDQGLMPEEEAIDLIQMAIKEGINTFDCARGYGLAEHRLGKGVLNQPHVKVITKLSPFVDAGQSASFYKEFVKASIYQSCRELQRQTLDTLMLHRFWQYQTPAIKEELLSLKANGVIKSLGVSVNSVEEAKQALKEQEFDCIQMPFNLLDWRWREQDFQDCINDKNGKTIFVRSVYLQGLFANPIELWPNKFKETGKELIKQLTEITIGFKRKSIKDLCMSYVRSQSWIHHIVVGCLSKSQLAENMDLFNEPVLSSVECAQIEKLLPKLPEDFLNPTLW